MKLAYSFKTSYHIVGKFEKSTFLSIQWKKVWRINKSANRLLIVSADLDGFSLANHGWFKSVPPQNFPLYSIFDNADS